jgi:hypothetical protein
MIKLLNRVTGYAIITLLIYFIFTIPSTPMLITCGVLMCAYLITGKYAGTAYLLLCFAIPTIFALFIPLKQLNKYPSVAVFYVSFIWTTLFVVLLLFFNKKKIKK